MWIPIKIKYCKNKTNKLKATYLYEDLGYIYDCEMPKNNEKVLVLTHTGNVEIDKFIIEDDGSAFFETYFAPEEVIMWSRLEND